mgnify:CR=1 FL=1
MQFAERFIRRPVLSSVISVGLVLVGAILTVVALFYYLLVAKRMYIDAPEKAAPVTAPFLLNFSIFLCVAGVVGFGVYPKPLVMAALRAASSLF